MATSVVPKPKPKAQPSFVYFRKAVPVNPALKSGNLKKVTYLKTEDTILWPYRIKGDENVPVPVNEGDNPELVNKLILEEVKGNVQWLPRKTRYIYGLQTFFLDEQEPNNRPVAQNVLENYANRDALILTDEEIRIPATDKVRIGFLQTSNQCENQHPLARRYGSTKTLYKHVDFATSDREKAAIGKKRDEAVQIARTARVDEMIPHAKYLGIPFIIAETDETRDMDAIREDYKDKAYNEPILFLDSFSSPTIKLVYQISNLLDRKEILVAQGVATWNRTKAEIAVITPGDIPAQFLADFSLTREGEDFAKQLTAFKNLDSTEE